MERNSLIVRLRLDGGNLVATIPQQLARELGWSRRDYVRVYRAGPAGLGITLAEVRRRDTSDVSVAPD